MAIKHGDNARNVMCDAVLDLINANTDVDNPAYLRIIDSPDGGAKEYESGNVAADANDTDASPEAGAGDWTFGDGGEVIAQLAFSNESDGKENVKAFKPAGDPQGTENGDEKGRIGKAHANKVYEDPDCYPGTANHFEIVDGAGNLILNGAISVSDGGGDIILTSLDISREDTIAIRNLSYTCAP